MTIEQHIRNFLDDNFFLHTGGDSSGLSDTDSFMEKGIIDSTGILEFTHFIEETFKITIADEDMRPQNLDSIDAVCAFVEKKQNGN